MKNYLAVITVAICFSSNNIFAQLDTAQRKQGSFFTNNAVKPRMRVIIDNDFGGDPDGLFQLVHHLLSPSVEIKAIIGSHLKPGDGFDNSKETATHAKQKVQEVLNILNLGENISLYEGSNFPLENITSAQKSEAAKAIIKEAMRTDTKLPLFIVCGAGLTDLASAWLLEPQIASHLTLIWIGGPEYPEMALPPPGYTSLEYNLGIDIKAVQIIFNMSKIPIWQIPRNTYRQVMLPYSSLKLKVEGQGKIGIYLVKSIESIMQKLVLWNYNPGEIYILGDSPLVLLTALQSSFEADPSSSQYVLRPSPLINDQGLYEINAAGRNIRVYKEVDTRLIFEDFYSKLILFNQSKP